MRDSRGAGVLPLLLLAGMVAPAGVAEAATFALPFGASKVDPGRLPRPVGLGVTLYEQSQDYSVTSLSFNVPGIVIDPGSDLQIDNKLKEANLKLDLWLFPFLNVFGIVGQLEGKTKVDLRAAELPVPLTHITIDYDGDVYGAGVTLAAGTERFFGSLTGIFTETSLAGDFDSEVNAFVLAPKVGLHGERGSFWLGAMYQEAEEKHAGRVSIPFFGAVDFAVELAEEDAWNLQAGIAGALSEHWFIELEGGTVGRLSSSLALVYRF
jgi:hypothetical protein